MKLFAAKLRNLKYGEQIRYRGPKVILNKNTFEDILTAFVRIYQLLTFEFERISDRSDHFQEALDGWIPYTFLKDCNFKALVKKLNIDHYLP